MAAKRLRVLLVPDSVFWVAGTIAKSIAKHNAWIDATIASAPVIDDILNRRPSLMRNFDLVHFVCPSISRVWMPRFRELMPCVTSHHHVTDWDAVKHNVEADAIITGSTEWRDDLIVRGVDPRNVFRVPYGVDSSLFAPPTSGERSAVRGQLGISDEATVVGFFARASSNDDDRKGTGVLADAVLQLSRRLPSLAVVIVGPGWGMLVDAFRAAGVNAIWLPFIRDLTGVRTVYRALDFYWVTARVEGGPVPLLEAMSSGVCCLTTPVGLARDIVRDGINGRVLSFDDASGFTETTMSLATDAATRARIGEEARKTIVESMDAAKTSRLVAPVYERAFENFSVRTGRRATFDLAAASSESVSVATSAGDEVPLRGFPPAVQREARMLESLRWGEALYVHHRERRAAMSMIARGWLANPTSVTPARVFLRRFLPERAVAQIVRLKHSVQRAS